MEEKDVLKSDIVSILEDEDLNSYDKLDELHEILVPGTGNAGTVAGELIRAIVRIIYRSSNDGDVFYEGYGIDTCGNAAAYIINTMKKYNYDVYPKFEEIALKGLEDEDYDDSIIDIGTEILDLLNNKLDELLEKSNDDMYKTSKSIIKSLQPLYDAFIAMPNDVIKAYKGYIISEDDIIEEIRD